MALRFYTAASALVPSYQGAVGRIAFPLAAVDEIEIACLATPLGGHVVRRSRWRLNAFGGDYLTLNDGVLGHGPGHEIIGDHERSIIGASHRFGNLLEHLGNENRVIPNRQPRLDRRHNLAECRWRGVNIGGHLDGLPWGTDQANYVSSVSLSERGWACMASDSVLMSHHRLYCYRTATQVPHPAWGFNGTQFEGRVTLQEEMKP